MKYFLVLSVVVLSLFGCATQNNPQALNVEVQKGKAKLVITRNTDFVGAAIKARVDINGVRVYEFSRGEVFAKALDAGKTNIAVDAWGTGGNYILQLDVEPNKVYTVEIAPQNSGFLLLGAFGAIGNAAVATQNNGPFSLTLKSINNIQE